MTEHQFASLDGRRHLLLVDDEESILSSLRRMLRRDGYTIHLANGGEQGLEVVEREPIGVIVSDQRMPGMTGSEFLAKVKERHPETVRIVLSGYTELDSITEAINQGAIYKFLTKPWDDEQLRAQIADAFVAFEMRRENRHLAALNQAIVDAVPDALLLVNPARRCVVTGNQAAAALLGRARAELASLALAEIEPLPLDACYWDEVTEGGFRALDGIETDYRSASGELIPVRKTTAKVRDGSEELVLVLARDLAEERAFKSSLERANAELAAVFEATSEGLLVLDEAHGLKRVNRRLTAMCELTDEVFAQRDGAAVLEFIARNSCEPEQTAAAFRAYLADPQAGTRGQFACRRGGTVRWCANPQRLQGEVIGHVFGFVPEAEA